jgi:hypothetical protein
MRLPSGQDIARAMGVEPLDDSEIRIGKFTDDPVDIKGTITDFGAAFAGNCPLWTYVLAETKKVQVSLNTKQGVKQIATRQLGEVGGRIVAETFIGLLLLDEWSYFNQNPIWQPSQANAQGRFRLKEFIQAALSG